MSDDADSFLRAVAAAPPRPRPAASLSGTTIEQYRICEVIGRGGIGVVYRAEDTRLQRQVAIKVLQTPRTDDPMHRERFLREARSAAALTHPNVVTVHEIGEHDGFVFLVMEYVEGSTLAARLVDGPLPPEEAIRIATALARGLARAHANKIIHRDIKPSNVMLDAEGAPKLLDFGLAKVSGTEPVSGHATTHGAIVGTPQYMSPEQARGSAVDERSDVFSFGVMLYEMIGGTPPFVHASFSETVAAILRDPHRPLREVAPQTKPDVEAIVDRCLAKAAEDRYATAGEVLAALTALRPGAGPRRNRRQLAVGGVILACVLVALAALAWHGRDDSRSAPSRRAITDWPAPKSSSHEATIAYAAALQAVRDGNFTAAQRHLAAATKLDPTFAAALLRRVLLGDRDGESMRKALNTVREHRESLDARDQQLLVLAQDGLLDTPPHVAADHARAFAAAHADDAEAQLWAGVALQSAGDPARSAAAMSRALELDPKLAAVDAMRALWSESAGDLDGALAAADRCLAISAGAATCLRRRMNVHALRADCAAFAEDTRELVLREPESDVNYENRITALAAQGAPPEALRELARKAEALVGDADAARKLAAANAARIAVYEGDFATAEARFLELEQLQQESSDERQHFSSVYRMGLYEEIGDGDKAIAAANDYLQRRPAWLYDGQGFPRAYALAIQHRHHVITDAARDATRAGWLAEDRRLGQTDPTWLWLAYYAWPALTPAEARDAVAALPAEPLHLEPLGFAHGTAAGRTFLLAGDYDRAWEVLRGVSGWCGATIEDSADTTTVGWQFVIVQLHLNTGLVLEHRGDQAGACAQYALVLERWGHAKPRSVTADQAREHAAALRCPGAASRAG